MIAELDRDILSKFSFLGVGRQQFHSQDEKSIKREHLNFGEISVSHFGRTRCAPTIILW